VPTSTPPLFALTWALPARLAFIPRPSRPCHACSGACWPPPGLSPETLRCTSLGELGAGSPVNLERSLRPDSRMGGHFVQVLRPGLTCLARALHWPPILPASRPTCLATIRCSPGIFPRPPCSARAHAQGKAPSLWQSHMRFTPPLCVDGGWCQGHVDATGTIVSFNEEGDSLWVRVKAPESLMPYIVPKVRLSPPLSLASPLSLPNPLSSSLFLHLSFLRARSPTLPHYLFAAQRPLILAIEGVASDLCAAATVLLLRSAPGVGRATSPLMERRSQCVMSMTR